MDQKWHIKVIEKRRKEVDRALLLQAVVSLAKQLHAKREQNEQPTDHTEDNQ